MLAIPFFSARKERSVQTQRGIYNDLTIFKRDTEKIHQMIVTSSSAEGNLAFKPTLERMLKNHLEKWNHYVSIRKGNGNQGLNDPSYFTSVFYEYVSKLFNFLGEGMLAGQDMVDILENERVKAIKALAGLFKFALPKPREIVNVESWFESLEGGEIFHFEKSFIPELEDNICRIPCKVTSFSKEESDYGMLAFDCNGKVFVAHYSDLQNIFIHTHLLW